MEAFKITETEIWAYISKTADNVVIQKVEKWMDSPHFDENLFNQISTVYSLSLEENTSVEQAKNTFFNTVKSKPPIWKEIVKYAAILAVIISGAYTYNHISSNKNLIVVQTSFGKQKQIELSDGSKVWLNAASKLSYNSEKPRTLYLEGEGFFEVAKDSLHPFTVTTSDDITVKALGTSFNIKSYKNSLTTETKLLTGKVEVTYINDLKNKALMNPNEKVVFYKDRKDIVKSKMDFNEAKIAWKGGEIQFKNKTFKEIAGDLKAQFNVQINFKNETIAKSKFTGTFKNTTAVDEIFEILKISKNFDYKLNTETNEWMIK